MLKLIRRLFALLALVLAFGAMSAASASAHPVACNPDNAHYQDMPKLKNLKPNGLKLQPSMPGIRCSTAGSKVFVFKLVGPCHTWFQTVGVDKETNLPGGIRWSATYRVSKVLLWGWNRCKPRR